MKTHAKKVGRLFLIVALVLMAILLLSTSDLFLRNRILLLGMKNQFESQIQRYDSVEVLDCKAVYGKLNGNGNGVNYFGACLVSCDNAQTLSQIADALRSEYEVVGYTRQDGPYVQTEYNAHQPIQYGSAPLSGSYYTLYFYNSNHPLSNTLDPKGH